MTKIFTASDASPCQEKHHRRRCRANIQSPSFTESGDSCMHIDVGRCLRELRASRDYTMRALAEQSGLNINTLSLIENGKTSPSVSTLQQLALALDVPITAFFAIDLPKNNISYQKAGQRPKAAFACGTLEDLGAGLTLQGGQLFLVNLPPEANSGAAPIVHTGHEFAFCLEGCLAYKIENQYYPLSPGDSILFEAHLPHCWQNIGDKPASWLLVMCPSDDNDQPTQRHFASQS